MRRTWIFVILLLAVLSVIFFAEKRNEDTQEPIKTESVVLEPTFLFDGEKGQVLSLMLIKDSETLELKRDDDGLWNAVQPEGAEVEQGVVEAAVAQLRSLPVLTEDLKLSPSDVGIREQATQVSVSFSSGKISAFRVGDPTPSGNGYYIQMDDEYIHIVDLDSLDTFLKLFTYFELEK